MLQFYLGPIYLLLLLPGTFALGLCKLGRAKQMGHALYSPLPNLAALQAPLPDLVARLLWLHRQRVGLQRPKCRGLALGPWVRESLAQVIAARGEDAPLVTRLRRPDGATTPAAQGADLLRAVGMLELFAPFALAVAGDVHLPRPVGFNPDGTAYVVHVQDVAALFAQARDNEHAAAMLARLYKQAATVMAGPGLFAALRDEAVVAELLAQSWR